MTTPLDLPNILKMHRDYLYGETGGVRADLSDADLSSAYLRDANLGRANLRGANLSSANLGRADLSDANLSRANLRDADLSRADLSDANLSSANLSSADLCDANLSSANLRGANLSSANLSRADLRDANLSRADLRDADLSDADLGRAKFSDTTVLDTGETWAVYLAEVVPALLTAGGRTVAEILTAGAWDCHDWQNCPMAEAFQVHDLSNIPALYRPRAAQFVMLFDAKLISTPAVTTISIAEELDRR